MRLGACRVTTDSLLLPAFTAARRIPQAFFMLTYFRAVSNLSVLCPTRRGLSDASGGDPHAHEELQPPAAAQGAASTPTGTALELDCLILL